MENTKTSIEVTAEETKSSLQITQDEKELMIKRIEEDLLKEVSHRMRAQHCSHVKKHGKFAALLFIGGLIGFGLGLTTSHEGHFEREGHFGELQQYHHMQQHHNEGEATMRHMMIEVAPSQQQERSVTSPTP